MEEVRARLCDLYTDQYLPDGGPKAIQFGEFKAIDARQEARLENYKPESPDDFAYDLTIDICPLDGPGVETFYARVCTPKWLIRRVAQEPISTGLHLFIVAGHDPGALKAFIETYVNQLSGGSWSDIIDKMELLAMSADRYPDDPGHHFS